MIEVRPFEDLAAMAVFRHLDVNDQIEAELTRGAPAGALALFADWRAMQPHAVLSQTVAQNGQPFAVFLLSNTGHAGVAQAALLARDHRRWRPALLRLALAMRRGLPGFAADHGIHRIEARAWADHPTASRLLAALGFTHEADMPGFGITGAIIFRQFAWTAPAPILDPIPERF